MLTLKPNCECCDHNLPPSTDKAVICTFECTFCKNCAAEHFNNTCPNCGGNLVTRPTRTSEMLEKYPASTQRYVNP
ncbi:UNVERIFIED_CONTAM: hypothetical protein GTU68_035647, partial [Idotea baltica]|nr:hypothetical protein [Idotea baltica]